MRYGYAGQAERCGIEKNLFQPFELHVAERVGASILLRLSPARGLVMLVFPVRRDGIVCIKKNKSVSLDIGVVITYTAVAYLTVSRSVYQIALSV